MKASLPEAAVELIEKGVWKGEKLVILKEPGVFTNRDVAATLSENSATEADAL